MNPGGIACKALPRGFTVQAGGQNPFINSQVYRFYSPRKNAGTFCCPRDHGHLYPNSVNYLPFILPSSLFFLLAVRHAHLDNAENKYNSKLPKHYSLA